MLKMSFLYNPRRMRGELSVPKQPFTFRNNAAPSIQHRFVVPTKPFERYGMRESMKTPVLSHSRAPNTYSPYEKAYLSRDEGYASAMEIDDMWNNEDIFEMENDFNGVEDNLMKRKNTFPHPEREYLPQKKVMHPRMLINKENQDYAKFVSESPKCATKRQAVLCADNPKGLGFKLEKKEKSVVESLKENGPKIYPKWNPSDSQLKMKPKVDNKNSTFPKIFTVTVEKLQTWRKALNSGQMIFELYGILDKVVDVKFPKCKKMLQLKSQNLKNNLMCSFYEIDRALPEVVLGQWCRCIVLWRQNNEYQCVTIRSASANELKHLDKWVVASSKSMAVVLKSLNEY